MSCICWNYLLKEAHANTWFHPVLQRRLKSQLLSPAWQFSNMALLLVSWGKTAENKTIICLTPPISNGREANMSLSHLREQRILQKNFCVSESCETLCMPQREGYDESLCCCIQPQSIKSQKTSFTQPVPLSCMCCCWPEIMCCISEIKVSEVISDCLYSRP